MLGQIASRALVALLLVGFASRLAVAEEKPADKKAAAKPAAAKPAEGKGDSGGIAAFGGFSFTSKKEPIEITSEKLDFDYKKRRTVFRGNVEVVQGDVHLRTDSMTVDYDQVGDKQDLKEVTADGHVTIVQGTKKATGNHAIFDQTKRTMVLTGDAILEEGTNQVSGDRIVVHPDDSKMEVLGENRRVKVVLFPGGATPGAAAATPPPATPAPSANADTEANGAGEGS